MIASSAEPANTSAFTKADLVRPWVSAHQGNLRHHSTYRSGWPIDKYAPPAKPSKTEWDLDVAVTFRHWYRLGLDDTLLTPSGQIADGCDVIQPRESRMILGRAGSINSSAHVDGS